MENDAISRSAAIEALNQHSYETGSDYDTTVEILESLPVLDVAPVVHARWRYKAAFAVNVRVSNTIFCTACLNGFHRIEGVNFNYCPFCGARMDGEAE